MTTYQKIFGVAALVAILGCLGVALDQHDEERDIAADKESALHDASALTRFEKAARRACGPNAAWSEVGHAEVQCFTKKGRKTQLIALR